MYYGDKREAKVKIMHKLVEAGWKVYGYTPDESDFMVDYYSPAHWSGVATKNGYVLLIDVCNHSLSGHEIRKYNYNNKQAVSNARIEKLTAMMNDEASTENEKASCATLIEKELEKGKVETSYTVEEVYPTYTHANPRGTTWHIEKDGQIIAKGKGVFSTNTYDWENKEVSGEKQKEIKINAFVERIEKVLKNSDALQPVVVKVEKKVIKPVLKEEQIILKDNILSFSYHGHYWMVTDIYTNSKGQNCVVYELLGSEKRGYQRLNGMSVKRYYQPMERLIKGIEEGKVKVYTLQEVTEYQEKTVFKKTARKQTVSNAPAIETTEEVKETVNNTEDNEVAESATTRQLWALHCATKLDTRGMKISKLKASELITKSKAGHSIIEEVKAIMNTNESIATDKEEANNEVVRQGDKEEKNQEKYISKIDKQIESIQKKLDSISGEYLTNTWKRQNEEASREEKRKQYRFDISLLQIFRDKAATNNLTQLEISLLNSAFREDIRGRYNSKTRHNFDIKYPEIDPNLDLDGWWNVEVPKRQKRYNKANIYNTEQLIEAVNQYGELVKAIEIPTNPIQQQIKKLENEIKLSKIPGFFPTPNNIVQRMIEFADIKDGETILEPSAGNGNILDGMSQYIMEEGLNVNLEALEWNHKLSDILELKQYKIVGNDFTEFIPNTLYDKIIMNPPFEKNQDIVHVLKAYDCLKDGGKLVSIMSPHWTFANDSKSVQFREWLSDKGTFEKLPEGSFKESGTGVNTVLVVIEKPVEVKPETESIQEPIVYPEIEINDLDQYTVSDELQNRLHSVSMFQVDYKRDCKVTFESIQNEALEVLSLTDNNRIQHHIKKYLQSFKKRYYEMYLKILNHRANNPSWAVTGRGGINVRRYNKKQDQYANMLSKATEMMNDFEQRLNKFKDEIGREEQRAYEAELNSVTSNLEGNAEFTTETKQIDYMGLKQKVRTYNYNGFTIAKTWGCYRVFKNGKEIDTNLKTTSKLDEAKRFVLYLDHKEK